MSEEEEHRMATMDDEEEASNMEMEVAAKQETSTVEVILES